MVTRERVVEEARKCAARRIPFRHQGRSEDGMDCVGTPLRYLQKAGWTPRDPRTASKTDYPRLPVGHELVEYLEREAVEVPREEVQPADFALMACHNDPLSRTPNHLAVFTPAYAGHSGLNIVHALYPKGVVEHGWTDEWQARTVAIYRLLDFVEA